MEQSWNMNCVAPEKEVTAIYLRVSTNKQGDKGYSIENQTKECKTFAKNKDWIIPDNLIFEENISASKIDGVDYDVYSLDSPLIRPEIKRLLFCASKKMFKHLIIYSRDRLTRVVEESLAIELALSQYGIDIHYAKSGETVNTDNKAIGRFIHLIFLCISEYESGLISKRVKSGNKNCVEKGYWPGGVTPIGYIRKIAPDQTNKKNTILTISNYESNLVKEIFELYLKGLGYKRIADIMNQNHAYMNWTKSKIETIIKNQTYAGSIIWDKRGGRRHPEKHKTTVLSPYNKNMEIISNKDWHLSKDFRIKRNETKDAHYYSSKYILKNVLYCSVCNNEMKPINPGKNKTQVYMCPNCKNNKNSKIYNRIPCKDLETEFLNHIKSQLETSDNAVNNSNFYFTYLKSISEHNVTVNSFINELDNRINEESTKLNTLNTLIKDHRTDEKFIEILTEQSGLHSNLLEHYKSSRNYYQSLTIEPKGQEEFLSLFSQWKKTLFDPSLAEEDLLIQRRNFIITFFDKVFVRKSKDDNKIIIGKIIFN